MWRACKDKMAKKKPNSTTIKSNVHVECISKRTQIRFMQQTMKTQMLIRLKKTKMGENKQGSI